MNRGSSGIAASVYLALAPGAACRPCDGGLVFFGKKSTTSNHHLWLDGNTIGNSLAIILGCNIRATKLYDTFIYVTFKTKLQ